MYLGLIVSWYKGLTVWTKSAWGAWNAYVFGTDTIYNFYMYCSSYS